MTTIFDKAPEAVNDPIVDVMNAFAADPRADKMDLGIGVYMDATGQTPVMKCVKAAEERLVEGQTSKSYIGVAGDRPFVSVLLKQLFPNGVAGAHMAGVQAVGGSGAIRLLMELAKVVGVGRTVWIPSPTWSNHTAIATATGLKPRNYPYPKFTGAVTAEEVLAGMAEAAAGDLVVIQLGCHNPTGLDLSDDELRRLAAALSKRGIVPLVDAAYLGFSGTFAQDAKRIEIVIEECPDVFLGVSCSKSFSVYRDRIGAAILVGRDEAAIKRAADNFLPIIRSSYSMPPDHGAAVVRTVLTDAALSAQWTSELDAIRAEVIDNRTKLAEALTRRVQSRDWRYLAEGHGMFAMIEIDPAHVKTLQTQHGIYMLPNGRINIAALNSAVLPRFVDAIGALLD